MKKTLSTLVCILSLVAFSAKAQAMPIEELDWKMDYSLGFVADSISGYDGIVGRDSYTSGLDAMYRALDWGTGFVSGSSGKDVDTNTKFSMSTFTTGSLGYSGVEGIFRADFFFTPPDSDIAIPLSFDFNFKLSATTDTWNMQGRTNVFFAQDSLVQSFVYGDYKYSFTLLATDAVYNPGDGGDDIGDGYSHPMGSFSLTKYQVEPASTPAPTPEPATMLLMGVGLAGLGFVARRRQKQA